MINRIEFKQRARQNQNYSCVNLPQRDVELATIGDANVTVVMVVVVLEQFVTEPDDEIGRKNFGEINNNRENQKDDTADARAR